MKKLWGILFIAMLVVAGCSNSSQTSSEEQAAETLKIGTLIPPMTDILEIVKPLMEEEGIDLEIIVLGDNIQPNNALQHEEIDANFFQHGPFMEQYNSQNDADLVVIEPIYHAIFGGYSKKYKSIDELPEGAVIAVPNDAVNLGRALILLDEKGLITLKDNTDLSATQADIVANAKNYKLEEVDLLMLARMMDDADLVMLYPAYAAPLGLTPAKDALITEGLESRYAISLVAREDNADSKAIKILAEKMTGPEVRKFLKENNAETALPAFE